MSERRIDAPPRQAKKTLSDKEVHDLFVKLKLTTPADREKFLRFEGGVVNPDPEQSEAYEAHRVVFGDSTSTASDSQ
jgi:hypothetical protein